METKIDRQYNSDGSLRSETSYVNGKKILLRSWYLTGGLEYVIPFVNGMESGVIQHFSYFGYAFFFRIRKKNRLNGIQIFFKN